MKIVRKKPHHKACFMANSDRMPGDTGHRPGDPWCLDYKNPWQFGDISGGNRGHTVSWLRLRCLDPKCEALILIAEFDLWEKVNEELYVNA